VKSIDNHLLEARLEGFNGQSTPLRKGINHVGTYFTAYNRVPALILQQLYVKDYMQNEIPEFFLPLPPNHRGYKQNRDCENLPAIISSHSIN